MEWLWKSKRMIFSSIIPRTAVTFYSPPVSPRGTKLLAAASVIPAEVRRRARRGSFDSREEPGSPKVSCIGQVTMKGKKTRLMRMTKSKTAPKRVLAPPPEEKKVAVPRRRSDVGDVKKAVEERSVPSIKEMSFASGRAVLSGFDWRVHSPAAVAPDV